jgi:hypothetical protein
VVIIAIKSPTIYHCLGIIVLVGVCFFLFWKGVMQMQYARQRSKDLNLAISRQLTKIIMSKMEILQNNKIEEESNAFIPLCKEIGRIRAKADTKKHCFQIGANLLFDGCRVFLFL